MRIEKEGKLYTSKKELICDRLRSDIKNGVLPAGVNLTLSCIAKRYSVSDIPAREAVQTLIAENYLEKSSGGLVVKLVSEEDLREIYELRLELEPFATARAACHMGPEEIAGLWRIAEASKAAIARTDFAEYRQLNQDFHNYIYQFTHNRRLTRELCEMLSYSARYPRYFQTVAHMERSLSEHIRMIHMVKSGDLESLRCLVRLHTKDSYDTVLRLLQESAQKETAEEG